MTHPAYIIDLESNQNDNNDNEAHNNLSTSITSSSVITTSSPLGTGGRECPICLELFTKIGHHRIVITKCGHAFGKKCLDRCLEIKNQCPTCRKTVRKRDLIELYDCDIVAVDNSNLEKLKYDLQIEKQNRVKVELENVTLNAKIGQMNYELSSLKAREKQLQEEISHLKNIKSVLSKNNPYLTTPPQSSSSVLAFEYTWNISDLNDARVLRSFCRQVDSSSNQQNVDTLLVSTKLPDNRYTIRRICLDDSRYRDNIGTYNAPIRDICTSAHNSPSDLVCITGNDRVATIISGNTGQNVMKLSLGSHTGWSCSFDESNPSCLWIGGSAGIVMLFDIRKLGGRVISSVCPYDSACLAAYQLASTSNISNECIPNLIPAQSTCGSSLNLTYPPIQSIVHSSSRPFGSSLDHLMICQGGHCRFVRIENHLSSITSSFVSLRNGMPVSVYDTQRWTHPYLERSCNYVLACRSHLLSGENRTQLPHPALRSISFDPVKQTIDHSTQQKVPIFDEGVTLTGHTLSTSGAKPHSTFVGYQFIKPLLPPDIEESNGNLDSGLMVACPNETHQSVFISVIAGNSTHQMDVICGHGEPIRHVSIIPQSDSRVLLASISSTQLTIHTISTEQSVSILGET